MIVGIGVDVVEIARMGGVIRRQGENFLRRVYTPSEQEFCRQRKNPFRPRKSALSTANIQCCQGLGYGLAKPPAAEFRALLQRKNVLGRGIWRPRVLGCLFRIKLIHFHN